MSRLFDLFNNPENLKSCKCQACSSSSRGGEMGWLIWLLCCFFCPFFFFFWLGLYTYSRPTVSNTHPPTPSSHTHSVMKERLTSRKGRANSNFHELKWEPCNATDLGDSWIIMVQNGQTILSPNTHTLQNIRENAVVDQKVKPTCLLILHWSSTTLENNFIIFFPLIQTET